MKITDIAELPEGIIDRLQHYFLTYKQLPGEPNKCEIVYHLRARRRVRRDKRSDQDYGELLANEK